MKFDELYLSDDILDAIDAMHFEECTPIQERTIPLITDGKDIIAVAQTGTGKTAAYLLPVIDEIANGDYPQDAINCIIMAPTRELAQQIDQQMQGFAYYMPVSSLPIYGGTDGHTFEQQKKGLKLGADVVIATPGRLIAHISMGYVDLSKVSFLILDEADRMLDMGFFDDIMQIVKHLPKERQTLLFSATMPPKIKQLAKKILVNPVEVKIAVSKPADKIDQSAFVCYETQKLAVLKSIFKSFEGDKSIIFASSKLKCKELAKTLRGLNLSVGEMHSDLDQTKRENMLLDFKSGKVKILVATDIVARGIDIDDIGLVVNYDVPHDYEDYVHRIGRTARANSEGAAITLVSEKDIPNFKNIERLLGIEVQKNQLPDEIGEGPEYDNVKKKSERRNLKKSKKESNQQNSNSAKTKSNQSNVSDEVVMRTNIVPSDSTSDSNHNSEPEKSKNKKNRRKKKTSVEQNYSTVEEKKIEGESTGTEAANNNVKEIDIEEISQSVPTAVETIEWKEVNDESSESQENKVSDNSNEGDSSEESGHSDDESVADSESANAEPKKKRKRKKKKKSEVPPISKEEQEILELGPDPYGDRPISYSMVSAMLVAEARERKLREIAERDARNSIKRDTLPVVLEDVSELSSSEHSAAKENYVSKQVITEVSGDSNGTNILRLSSERDVEVALLFLPKHETSEEETSDNSTVSNVATTKKKRPARKKKSANKEEDDNSQVNQIVTEEVVPKTEKRAPRRKKSEKKEAIDQPTEVFPTSVDSKPAPKKRTPRKKKTDNKGTSEQSYNETLISEETLTMPKKRSPRRNKSDKTDLAEQSAEETPAEPKKRASRRKKTVNKETDE